MNAGLVLTAALVVASFQGFGNKGVIALFVFSVFCALVQREKPTKTFRPPGSGSAS